MQGKERYRISRDIHNDEDIVEFDFVEKHYHKFDIIDAKDGDVLCTYECGTPKIVFVLKGTPKKPYVLGYYCYYNIMYPHFGPYSEKGCLAPNDEDVKPATKEQRDLLFQKMRETGYEWDVDKKELKKIEKKPTWNEEDDRLLDNCISLIEDIDCTKEEQEWLKSLKDRYTWKPSDEQMKALNEVLNFAANHESPYWYYYIFRTLNNLIRQLKKLKG